MNYKEQIKHPKWQRKRLEIMERDDFQCQCCFNREKQLNVHHKEYINNKKIWEYENELLITLCKDCHKEIHKLNNILFCDNYNITNTDYYIMTYRMTQMKTRIGITWITQLNELMTAYVITKEEI